MIQAKEGHRPVKTLPPEVARKIAAGEVIDRPNAILRELLDNAVDSGADSIIAEINGGGIEQIRIVDNGSGMTKEDLANCAKPHATSKITTEEDLLKLKTLGFRGEALSSIAAVSRLQITSAFDGEAWTLEAEVTREHKIFPANLAQGTIVQVQSLFENFPARRMFLKRPSAETLLCRQTFIEKALPRTDISFRLSIDGKQRFDLPKNQTLAQRFTMALELPESPSLFSKLSVAADDYGIGQNSDWKFNLLLGESAVHRNDKKFIFIYVNGRRISEYSLVQAIEYGAQGFFPNGSHPVAALFLDINPELVDFNIHPAKREARFKDLAPIHHAVSKTTRNFFKSHAISSLAANTISKKIILPEQNELYGTELPDYKDYYQDQVPISTLKPVSLPKKNELSNLSTKQDKREQFFSDSYSASFKENSYVAENNPLNNFIEKNDLVSRITLSVPTKETSTSNDLRYIGSTLGVFLLAEKNNRLYLIDQHAAHERILYNKFIAATGTKQPLLVPYVLETQSEEDDNYLESIKPQLFEAGFEAKNCGEGRWEFCSVPVQWKGSEQDLEKDLLTKRIAPEEVLSSMAATNACRAAVKDGHVLDSESAKKLVEETLELSDPHCPHGRPIWITLSKEELFQLVRRT